MDPKLSDELRRAARAPVLLVASDFDGTLADLTPTPDAASADEFSLRALRMLARAGHTHAAVISGRALAELAGKLRVSADGGRDEVRLVGSHGIEIGGDAAPRLNESQNDLMRRLRQLVGDLAADHPRAFVEHKPASISFHYRGLEPADVQRALEHIGAAISSMEGVWRLDGVFVVELFVSRPDKGAALDAIRRRAGASAVVFFGDDLTDEHAFAALRPGDVGVKIGPGPTIATARIAARGDMAECLDILLEERRAWLGSRRIIPIHHHAVLSDQRTVAIVDPRGDISWMCLPRIDSSAMFASMLGVPRNEFRIQPAEPGPPTQEYLPDTFILRTRWPGVVVTDYFDCSAGRPYQRAGRSELIRVIEGQGRISIRFAPKLDFGRVATRLAAREQGLEVEGWPDPVVLYSPGITWKIEPENDHHIATAEVELVAGEPRVLELRYGTASLRAAPSTEPDRRRDTARFWSGWAGTLKLPALRPDLVRRSALVLKALCHGPSGAIAAAGTTSLPEHLGGERNWDYRYCWPRDACLAAASLIRLGNTGVAIKLLDWLGGVLERSDAPDRLRPLYTVTGSHLGPEAELSELAGYGDSRPVRVGNAASNQVQLDVFGPIVELVAMLAQKGAPVTPEHWRIVEGMVQAVASRWQEPDHGIWEIRGPRRHHIHTKSMCWLAVDRALTVADLGMGRRRPDWEHLREQIAQDVLANGWSDSARAFTAAYGEPYIDAASLAVGLSGLLPMTDPRFRSTVDRVAEELLVGPVVYRYRYPDGLGGEEGGWCLCTWWLIESLAATGRHAEARDLFDRLCECAGPTGLLAEEFDPGMGLSLGNFPQAYSHLAVINSAIVLDGAPTRGA
ncbi:MAG: trehalose-phosphatase [Phycisphaerales bacterium]|nr:trehalose-phosphatase [Phycisphaerales bacterium]